ncbi:hypothetical protein CIG75_17295 [Tumebacillus algifaecis]|uniref:Nitroreductase domain-containing protein n=1 Tax=Tumebacillus algifaecis TaxID=1214604 RepID=A0A223D4L6_9BACL|nr:SagB family peptide dehydrogenase [Tumebacillus algifaecis]ASS76542.1 hypothetical protein CIG75_17295 [Tumebacillus algifaecis]
MSATLLTGFRPDVAVREQPDGTLSISLSSQTVLIRSVPNGLARAIRCLATTGASQADLEKLVLAHDGIAGMSLWYYWHRQFLQLNFICYPLEVDRVRIATVLSTTPELLTAFPAIRPTDACQLSRFASLRLDPELSCLRLETPLSPFALLLHDPSAVTLIGALSTSKTVEELAAVLPEHRAVIEPLLARLLFARLAVTIDETGATAETSHPTLPYWEFHDLLFHSQSRIGRSSGAFGGTYRFGKHDPPAPVVKPNMSEEIYPLYRPDLSQLIEQDASFSAVLSARRSKRAFDDEHPLTGQQVGEFLYRVARIQELLPASPSHRELELSKRPYPAGGALYELDIYVAILHSFDLPPGLYQYNPLQHELCKLFESTAELQSMVHTCRRAALPDQEAPGQTQALLLITSRFPRLSWKYESIAYATTLKNTGALYQTMYLAAAAMGLAGTAVGSGDADLFARLSGIDYYEETLVGEFLLGTAKATP